MKKVLIVDDFRISNEILTEKISGNGVQVISVQNPENAFDILRKVKIALVISDYHMPQMNGIELMLAARRLEGLGKLPFIILSQVKDPEVKELAKRENVSFWIDKPLTPAKIEQINQFIKIANA